MNQSRRQLIRILQAAYSGEMAAAYAYRGHWKALSCFDEKEMVYIIEDEEWTHRRQVRRMLSELDARPQQLRECVMWIVGRSIGLACHVVGRFMSMYFAGRLESGNVSEYENAGRLAARLGLRGLEEELMEMARTERSHERFFLEATGRHSLAPLMRAIFRWG